LRRNDASCKAAAACGVGALCAKGGVVAKDVSRNPAQRVGVDAADCLRLIAREDDETATHYVCRLLYYNISKDDGIAQAAGLSDGSEVIGKTGTVDNDYGSDTDRLFVGLTPEYCAAVWIGYDDENSVIGSTEYKLPASV
jgi:membrane carboxypeptidase/penicillin-binding protein